jgi:hypothetical protein
MRRLWLSSTIVAIATAMACSRPAEVASPAQNPNPVMTAEVKLTAPVAYPSGSTQSVLLSVAKLDESKGVIASANGACSASGAAEKVSPGTYRASITIPAHPEDGVCSIRLTSVSDHNAGAANISYLADPEYWKKNAPAMYTFAHSKTWTFHSGNDMKIFKLLEASPSSGKLAVLLEGDRSARAGMSLSPDNNIVGEFAGCVLEGKFAGTMATMKPMMQTESCQGVTTVTLMVSN